MTESLLAALCLVLVIEGLLPALAPQAWRNMVLMLAEAEPGQIRMIGIGSMILGAVLLFLVKRL